MNSSLACFGTTDSVDNNGSIIKLSQMGTVKSCAGKQGCVARQRPRPTLRKGCTCWVPTGDHGTYNNNCHNPNSWAAEVVTQSGTSVHLA